MSTRQETNAKDAKIVSTSWFCDGISLSHHLANYKERGLHAGSSETDTVQLHFGLKGDYSVSYKQMNKSFDLIGGHQNIFYSNGFDMEFVNKGLTIETFGVHFPKELFLRFTENANEPLKRFAEKIMKGESVMFSNTWGPINIPIQHVINQIINNQYSKGMQELFLLSKSIELLVLSAETCMNAENRAETYIKTKGDKEKIIAARDLINEKLKEPPSLSQISQLVGLNEYKLKKGFKEVFATTVFGYLNDQRLGLALNNLRDTQKTAAEIAYELGYATPQHFNNAFRKRFGITPNSVRKNP